MMSLRFSEFSLNLSLIVYQTQVVEYSENKTD